MAEIPAMPDYIVNDCKYSDEKTPLTQEIIQRGPDGTPISNVQTMLHKTAGSKRTATRENLPFVPPTVGDSDSTEALSLQDLLAREFPNPPQLVRQESGMTYYFPGAFQTVTHPTSSTPDESRPSSEATTGSSYQSPRLEAIPETDVPMELDP